MAVQTTPRVTPLQLPLSPLGDASGFSDDDGPASSAGGANRLALMDADDTDEGVSELSDPVEALAVDWFTPTLALT